MSAPPYMPFYINDYLADTTHLSCTEHGAYLMLLFCMWKIGGQLPDDDAKLAKFTRCTRAQWDRMRDTVLDFFEVGDGIICHPRIVSELEKYDVAVRQHRMAGSNGGKATALKNKNSSPANATAEPKQLRTQNSDIEDTDVSSIRAREGEGAFEAWWKAYPNKVGKREAAKSYAKALKRVRGPDPPAELLSGVARAKGSRRWLEGFVPNPATWLNQDRWLDEEPANRPQLGQINGRPDPDLRRSPALDKLFDIDAAMVAAVEQSAGGYRSG